MAIGLGKMLGFNLPENFNLPYMAKSFRDFWRRWHISLSTWFRDYVYIPLGGSKRGELVTYRNIIVVWFLTGLWHGANWTFIIWGACYGMLIIWERLINVEDILRRSHALVRILYRLIVFVVVMLLWVVFRAENVSSAYAYIRTMILPVSSAVFDEAFMYLSEYRYAFFMAIDMSTLDFSEVQKSLLNNDAIEEQKKSYVCSCLKTIILFAGFVVSISYLVKGTYSPFIYFNF